jgi:hypothetical protein
VIGLSDFLLLDNDLSFHGSSRYPGHWLWSSGATRIAGSSPMLGFASMNLPGCIVVVCDYVHY